MNGTLGSPMALGRKEMTTMGLSRNFASVSASCCGFVSQKITQPPSETIGSGRGREKENLAPSIEEEEGRGRKKGEGTSTTATIEMEARWSVSFTKQV